jgi:hypothetical protein
MAAKLSEPTGALAEGADRLERVVLSVKARQLAETHNAPVLKPAYDAFSYSPDEIWSKNYMTVGIGPSVRPTSSFPGQSTSFGKPGEPLPSAKLQPALAHSSSGTVRPVTIGEALAKPARRRTWLGRLVRGS